MRSDRNSQDGTLTGWNDAVTGCTSRSTKSRQPLAEAIACRMASSVRCPSGSRFPLLPPVSVLDSRVVGGIEDSFVAGFPADAVVPVAGLAEHLQDLSDPPALADTMPFDDDVITDAPLQDTLRLRQCSPPSRFAESLPSAGAGHQRGGPLTRLAGMDESRLTLGRPL
jgi:hypothetical protein